MPVEETGERGRKRRTSRNWDDGRGRPPGVPIFPLLSNLYLRRFVLGWKTLGHKGHLKTWIVNYADDFVTRCRHSGDEASEATRVMMQKLRLTVNETKTRQCRGELKGFGAFFRKGRDGKGDLARVIGLLDRGYRCMSRCL